MDDKRILFAFCLCFLFTQASAEKPLPVFASIDVAVLFSKLGTTQDVNLLGSMGDTYVATKDRKSTATAIFGLGVRTYNTNPFTFNTSVRYIPIPKTELQGNVWQLKSSRFNNLAYTYKLQSDVFFAENIASWTRYAIQPGLILGLGGARHKVGYYHVTPLNNRASNALGAFGNATRTQLAYEVGAALDYPCKHTVLELAYRFMDLGQGHLGYSPQQNTQDRLSTGPIRYQSLSFGGRIYYDQAV